MLKYLIIGPYLWHEQHDEVGLAKLANQLLNDAEYPTSDEGSDEQAAPKLTHPNLTKSETESARTGQMGER
jgi:hypothetical protein